MSRFMMLIRIILMIEFIGISFWFYAGYHNMDTGQNLKLINAQTGESYSDCNGLRCYTPDELYNLGVNQIMSSFFFMSLIAGISVFFSSGDLNG